MLTKEIWIKMFDVVKLQQGEYFYDKYGSTLNVETGTLYTFTPESYQSLLKQGYFECQTKDGIKFITKRIIKV